MEEGSLSSAVDVDFQELANLRIVDGPSSKLAHTPAATAATAVSAAGESASGSGVAGAGVSAQDSGGGGAMTSLLAEFADDLIDQRAKTMKPQTQAARSTQQSTKPRRGPA